MVLEKKKLLGVEITNATESQVLEYILQSLQKKTEKYFIVTPNPEILVFASKHNELRKILNQARLGLCDGTGVFWAGKFLGKSFKQRITGTDLLENLCREVAEKPITVGFLGGGPKIAETTAECLAQKYPRLKVGLAQEEWPNDDFSKASRTQETVDILFVAFGFPKQEEWISQNLDKIPVRIAMGVGGAFDYISGSVKRAPLIIRMIGFEWLYRLVRQPWRWKRQLALLEFSYLVLKEKLTS